MTHEPRIDATERAAALRALEEAQSRLEGARHALKVAYDERAKAAAYAARRGASLSTIQRSLGYRYRPNIMKVIHQGRALLDEEEGAA